MPREKVLRFLRSSNTFYYTASFVVAYLLLLALNFFYFKGYSPWDSIMYYLYPVPGFFFAVMFIPWINSYTKTRLGSSIYFPIAVLFLAYLSFFVVLVWYYNNMAALSNIDGFSFNQWFSSNEDYVFKKMVYQAVRGSFTKFFLSSAFGAFILSSVLGWFSYTGLELRQGKKAELFSVKAK